MIDVIDIKSIRPNPSNPRVIKDDKFKKLVRSIKEFPQMLSLRPIVVNEEMVILGGNMRYRACIDAGLSEVPIVIAENLTEEEQREFIIKDNVGFGEWDWDDLANNWDEYNLKEWGLDIPKFDDAVIEDDIEMDTNYVKLSVEVHNEAFIEMQEKLQNLCDEFNAILKIK